MGHISGVAEPFFSENQPNVMTFGFFALLAKYVAGVAYKYVTTTTLGLFQNPSICSPS